MEPSRMERVRNIEVTVLGAVFVVELTTRANGKCTAITRYGPDDVIITDGLNEEEALAQHNAVLPVAIGCRRKMALDLFPPKRF